MSHAPKVTAAALVIVGLLGLVGAVIVILNLHIYAGLEEGYAASPAEVWSWSKLLAVVDVGLLVGCPALGIYAVARSRHRREPAAPDGPVPGAAGPRPRGVQSEDGVTGAGAVTRRAPQISTRP